MAASITKQIKVGITKMNRPDPTVTLIRNLKPGDEFDLSGAVMPPGYKLIVESVHPEPGTTELVKVFFKQLDDGHIPTPARMNGNFPVSVFRKV